MPGTSKVLPFFIFRTSGHPPHHREHTAKSTVQIVEEVWKNSFGNIFSKDDKHDKEKTRRDKNTRRNTERRKSHPIFDKFVRIAAKSAIKYFTNELFNNNKDEKINDSKNKENSENNEKTESELSNEVIDDKAVENEV